MTKHWHGSGSLVYDNAAATEGYLREYFETGSSIRSLADIVEYNKDHPEMCLPKGEPLISH